jgi:hypothetical protein
LVLTKRQKQQHGRANKCCLPRIGDLMPIGGDAWKILKDLLSWYCLSRIRLKTYESMNNYSWRWSLHSMEVWICHVRGTCTISKLFSRSTLGRPTTRGGRCLWMLVGNHRGLNEHVLDMFAVSWCSS